MAEAKDILEGLQKAVDNFTTDRLNETVSSFRESMMLAGKTMAESTKQAQSFVQKKVFAKLILENNAYLAKMKGFTAQEKQRQRAQFAIKAQERALFISSNAVMRDAISMRKKDLQSMRESGRGWGAAMGTMNDSVGKFLSNLKGQREKIEGSGPEADAEKQKQTDSINSARQSVAEAVGGAFKNMSGMIKNPVDTALASIDSIGEAFNDVGVMAATFGVNVGKIPGAVAKAITAGLTLIMDEMDVVRKPMGELTKSLAATGRYTEDFKDQIGILGSSATREHLKQWGEGIADYTRDIATLRGAGMYLGKSAEEIGVFTSSAKVLAIQSGQDLGVVAGQLFNLQKNFGLTGKELTTGMYTVLGAANDLAHGGFGKVEDQMKNIFSLADSIAETGASIQQVSSMTLSFASAVNKIKLPKGQITKVGQEIMKLSQLSNQFMMYIGLSTGKGGGNAVRAMMQQQGRQGTSAGNRHMNPQQMANDVWKTISMRSAGQKDPYMKKMVQEQMGEQMGLSKEAVEILQMSAEAGWSTTKTNEEMEKLEKAGGIMAKDTNAWLKSIKEILGNWFLRWNLQAATKVGAVTGDYSGTNGGGSEAEAERLAKMFKEKAQAATDAVDAVVPSKLKKKSKTGVEKVDGAGPYWADAGEGIVSASSMGNMRSKPIGGMGGMGMGGGNSIHMTINAGTNAQDLKRAFDMCYQKSLSAINQNNKAMYGITA